MAREREQLAETGGREGAAITESLEELALRCLGLEAETEEPVRADGPVLRLEELVADESGAIVFETSGVTTIYLETSAPVSLSHATGADAAVEDARSQSCLVVGPSTVLYFPPELEVRIVNPSD